MNVILMGAGASKAYGASRTGQRMPVALDFFKTYRNLDIYNNPWVLRGQLLSYIRKDLGLDPEEFLAGNIDIEDIHSQIEEKMLESMNEVDSPDRLRYHAAFTEMSSIFACVVNTIQKGPVSQAHRNLAQALSPEDVLITFNWDTLMDRALESETSWRTDSGYGFSPKKIFRNQWEVPEKLSVGGHPKLIKLHGSANWLTSHSMIEKGELVFTQLSAPESVWVVEDARAPYHCYAGRFMAGYERLSCGYYPPNIGDDSGKSPPEGYVFIQTRPKHSLMPEGTAGSDGLVSVPLIIPPVRQKRYDLFGPLFKKLWESAEAALTEADQITIIGYSFPKTDLKTHDLFKRAFVNRGNYPEIVILDPAPENALDVFNRSLGIPIQKIKVIKELFTDDFDLTRLGGAKMDS